MNSEEKILISKECIDKIRSGLNTIKVVTKDKNIKKEAEELLRLLEAETSGNELSLDERILKKMRETKNVDPDMNANLYILHRKLVNNQITEQQALQMFEMYIKDEGNGLRFY